MANIVTGTVPNLIQGVSQQPKKDRLQGQVEAQLNMSSDVVKGNTRRGGAKRNARLGTTVGDNFYYTYKRDADEWYTVVLKKVGTSCDVEIIDKDGNPITVTNLATADGLAIREYLSDTSSLVAHTIGDVTVLANKTVTPALEAGLTPALSRSDGKYYHIVWMSGAEYGREYTITYNGSVIATKTTPVTVNLSTSTSGTNTDTTSQSTSSSDLQVGTTLDPGDILQDLRADLAAAGWTATLYEDTYLVFYHSTSGEKNVAVSANGLEMMSNHKVRDLKELPGGAVPGMYVKVEGANDKVGADDVYLQFNSSVSGVSTFTSQGSWKEVAGPGEQYKIDKTTMPVSIRQVDLNTFTIEYPGTAGVHWKSREAGDSKTNKVPSFIGRPIENIGSFQNRLFFLAEDRWVLSRTDDYWNFWKYTAVTDRDDDRIDVIAPSATVSLLKHSVLYNKNLILFSEGTQYIQRGDTAITGKTVNLGVTTNYTMDLRCSPEPTGDSVIFTAKAGNFANIQQFRVEDISNRERATSISAHVPEYIPKDISRIIANSALNTFIAQPSNGGSELYVYQWYYQGNALKQQAWHKWDFPTLDVHHIFFADATLCLIATPDHDPTALEFYCIDMTGQDIEAYNAPMLLDMWEEYTPTSWTDSGNYHVLTPSNPLHPDSVCIQGIDGPSPGLPIDFYYEGGEWRTKAFLSGTFDVYTGVNYTGRVTLTPPFIKNPDGTNMSDAPLFIRDINLSVVETGAYKVIYEHKFTDDYEVPINSLRLGETPLGEWYVSTGSDTIPIFENTEDLTLSVESVGHIPMTLTDFEWHGIYRQSGRYV